MDGEISAEELDDLLAEGADVRVVDIRSPRAYEQGRIPDSENIPMGDLPQQVERLEGAERVVTVCPHGKASVQAARLVDSYEGFDGDVESLAGGVEEWVADGRPWEAPGDDGEATDGSDADEADAPF